MSTKKSPAAITFAEAFKQLADEGREAKIRYDQACVRTTSTPRKPPHEERERQTQEAMSMPEPKKPRRTSLLDKIKAHNPIGEERQQQSREILDRMVPGGNPHSESHSELHGVNLTPGSSPSPPKRLDRLREIYQSHEGYEGNYENWKNLQKIQGMSEELLAECLDECKYPALFLEDICRLDYSFGVPGWVAKIKDQTRKLAYFKASLVRGSVIPAEGYESPVEAGQEALEASLRAAKERAERSAKCLAKRTLLAWWEAKPEDERARLFLQPPSPFMAKIKHEYDEEHKDGQD